MAAEHSEVPAPVRQVQSLIAGIEGILEEWARDLGRDLSGMRGVVPGAAIDALVQPAVKGLLARDRPELAGAGFIANSGLVGPDRSYIAWWQGQQLERVDALANFSPSSMERYLKAEWFRIPVGTGLPHATGPYIDFLCTDDYVVTFTHPVRREGSDAVAGIVGTDVAVRTLEQHLIRGLRQLGPAVSLVSAEGRVVVSSAVALEPGDLIEPDDAEFSYPVGRRFSIWGAADPQVPGV
ncbi:cache domain-containing protein [Arthrobacter sp. TMN-37]